MLGILGKKIGMTQIFEDDGTAVPVTLVQAGPCVVVQRKTDETDGYEAVQLGLVETNVKNVNQPRLGHFSKAGVQPVRRLFEFAVAADDESKPGDEVKVSQFEESDRVDVTATSKGKGFQGVMKRYGFGGGRATHGSMFHRSPGSIGQASDPSRVYPGTRLPGQMGNKRITTKNLKIVKVDEERDLLYLRCAVPGPKGGYVAIRPSKRG